MSGPGEKAGVEGDAAPEAAEAAEVELSMGCTGVEEVGAVVTGVEPEPEPEAVWAVELDAMGAEPEAAAASLVDAAVWAVDMFGWVSTGLVRW
jgi:hypothetical protein